MLFHLSQNQLLQLLFSFIKCWLSQIYTAIYTFYLTFHKKLTHNSFKVLFFYCLNAVNLLSLSNKND